MAILLQLRFDVICIIEILFTLWCPLRRGFPTFGHDYECDLGNRPRKEASLVILEMVLWWRRAGD